MSTRDILLVLLLSCTSLQAAQLCDGQLCSISMDFAGGGSISASQGATVDFGSGGSLVFGTGGFIDFGDGGSVTPEPVEGESPDMSNGGSIVLGPNGSIEFGEGGSLASGENGGVSVETEGALDVQSAKSIEINSDQSLHVGNIYSAGNVEIYAGRDATIGYPSTAINLLMAADDSETLVKLTSALDVNTDKIEGPGSIWVNAGGNTTVNAGELDSSESDGSDTSSPPDSSGSSGNATLCAGPDPCSETSTSGSNPGSVEEANVAITDSGAFASLDSQSESTGGAINFLGLVFLGMLCVLRISRPVRLVRHWGP